MAEKAKYLLIVKVPRGIVIVDRPAPQSAGALKMRAEGVGKVLQAYGIHNVNGVDYARLIPQNPQKPEWVRVAEADHSIEYVDVIPLGKDSTSQLADAITLLATAVRELARK